MRSEVAFEKDRVSMTIHKLDRAVFEFCEAEYGWNFDTTYRHALDFYITWHQVINQRGLMFEAVRDHRDREQFLAFLHAYSSHDLTPNAQNRGQRLISIGLDDEIRSKVRLAVAYKDEDIDAGSTIFETLEAFADVSKEAFALLRTRIAAEREGWVFQVNDCLLDRQMVLEPIVPPMEAA